MSRETRELRPFDVPEVLEDLFAGTRLHVGAQTIESGAGALVWPDRESFSEQEITLEWAVEDTFDAFRLAVTGGAKELGIEASALSIVVFATSGYLGTAEVVFEKTMELDQPAERIVDLARPDRPVGLSVVGRRANRIAVFLLLNRELEKGTLRPWRKGTWLARCEFRIGLEAPTSLFRPTDLTDKERKHFRLLPGAVRYLDRATCDPAAPLSPDDPPRFYVVRILESEGYDVETGVLAADAMGWPQTRKRFFLVARRGTAPIPLDQVQAALADPNPRDLRWAIGDLDGRPDDPMHEVGTLSDANQARIAWLFDNDEHDLAPAERPECHRDGTSYQAVYGRLHWDRPAPTITTGFLTPGRGRYVHPGERRTLTPREAARLQGFPDSYRFFVEGEPRPSRGELAKWIGDAVPMPLGYAAVLSVLAPDISAEKR